ncbi:MAG: hypothetical protein FJ209_12285, partial [Betaproteobacteria bacterium]|nr:hypothetical protein [Betaproteobacteria bacterium]
MSGERREFAWAIVSASVRGRLAMRLGHLPPAGHRVPEDFTSVAVAPTADPNLEDAQLARLAELGVRRVRLDFTYGDAGGPAEHLLERLCAAGYRVTLHLLQPFAAARQMPAADACEEWARFCAATLTRHGPRIAEVEATSTINRRRWAGYNVRGMLAAWRIAHDAVRRHGLPLAGPSITDFEPALNVGVLALLRRRKLLPDLHADNLFCERSTEPERWDHKILGHWAAPWISFNLVKKARLLARVGADAGVPRLISPAAFWTLPRIERVLADSEEKQADYLTRYFVLCAASGALERAGWGPLACHREGLLDNGEEPYPELERITHYARVDGAALRVRPAFRAMAACNRLLPGRLYEGRLSRSQGLEIHAFSDAEHRIHAVWTMNGLAAALPELYDDTDLTAAELLDRDGNSLTDTGAAASRLATLVITESPLFLRWPIARRPAVRTGASPLRGVTVHAHGQGRLYYHRNAAWHGMVRAQDGAEADLLLEALDPSRLVPPARQAALRHARNAIWTLDDPRHAGGKLVVKQPVKHHLHKKLLDRLKPSKARRSWNGACELLRRGVATAAPVAWLEARDGGDLTRNWYVCDYVEGGLSVGSLFTAYNRGQAAPSGITPATAHARLAEFLVRMHNRGLFFRDLSGGNILIRVGEDGAPEFSLIDTARIRVYRGGVPPRHRLSD